MGSKIGGLVAVLGAAVAGLALGGTIPGGFALALFGGLVAAAGFLVAVSA